MYDIKSKLHKLLLQEGIKTIDNKLVKRVDIDDQSKKLLKTISWNDIKVEDDGTEFLRIELPFGSYSEGILLKLQETPNGLYQIHIDLAPELQRIGLGTKIYKAVLNYMGYIYSAKARRMSNIVDKLWNSLHNDPEIECHRNEYGDDVCFTKNNDQDYIEAKKEILQKLSIKQ